MKSRTCIRRLAIAVYLLTACASTASAQSATLNAELVKDWLDMKSTIMKLAAEMPADKYAFKATPAERDFAQQVLHIAQANVTNLVFLRGKATPPILNRSARSKADVMQAMADSFDYGEALIREQTPASMFDVVQTNAFLGPSTRARVVYFLIGHTWDIYGQLVVYLRENGGVPLPPVSDRSFFIPHFVRISTSGHWSRKPESDDHRSLKPVLVSERGV